jgi:Flp pilus assembly secretin CpaC
MPKLLPALLLAAALCHAQEFSLQGDQGKIFGPFVLKTGVQIAIGSNKAVIAQTRQERDQYLDGLREVIIPQVDLTNTTLRQVVVFLLKAAEEQDLQKRGLRFQFDFSPEEEKDIHPATISIHARAISVLDVLRVATECTRTKFRLRHGVVTIMPMRAAEDDLLIREYVLHKESLRPGVLELMVATNTMTDAQGDVFLCWTNSPADYFRSFDVKWPARSSITCDLAAGRLRACNTRENLDRIGQLIDEAEGAPRLVHLDMHFVSFGRGQINRLSTSGAGINTATLSALWAGGDGELVTAPSVTTRPGQEAMLKGGTEFIYPANFGLGLTAPPDSGGPVAASNAVAQDGFQTREAGITLQVVPEVSETGPLIRLNLNPQFVEDPVWRDFGPAGQDPTPPDRPGPMKQPFFHVYNLSMSIATLSGHRVLAGGGWPTRDHQRLVYAFVTATLENASGMPLLPGEDSAERLRQAQGSQDIFQFTLRDSQGRISGPFVCNGLGMGEVSIGAATATFTRVEREEQLVERKLRQTVIPELNFRHASIQDVIATLQKASVTNDPQKRGVSFVLAPPQGELDTPLATPDPFAEEDRKGGITFSAKFVSLWDAVKIITEISYCKFRLRGHAVMITPGFPGCIEDFEVRSYKVPCLDVARFNECGRRIAAGTGDATTNSVENRGLPLGPQDLGIKACLENLGVPWPEGTHVRCLPAIGLLRIGHFPWHFAAIEKALVSGALEPLQVKMDVQFVAFDRTNIARLVAAGAPLDTAALAALWTNGCGELIAAPTVVTGPGQEAVVLGDTEVLYPTSFAPAAIVPVGSQRPVVPGHFSLREAGVILQVVPELSADNRLIQATFSPQVVEESKWEDLGPATKDAAGKAGPSQIQQPYFHVFSTSTSVSLASGKRVMIGGGMPSRDGRRLVYVFVTATIVNLRGEALNFRDGDATAPTAR